MRAVSQDFKSQGGTDIQYIYCIYMYVYIYVLYVCIYIKLREENEIISCSELHGKHPVNFCHIASRGKVFLIMVLWKGISYVDVVIHLTKSL